MVDNTVLCSTILESWQACINTGLSEDINKPQERVTKRVIDNITLLNAAAIKEFNNLIEAYIGIIRSIKGIHNFLLLNEDLTVISYKKSPYNIKHINRCIFMDGISYNESSLGTNAASIAKILKTPVYMYPQYNYCNILKNWYMYCIPVKYNSKTDYYICLLSYKSPIIKPMEGFLDLIGTNMNKNHSNLGVWDMDSLYCKDYLTGKQKLVLKKIAKGLSNQEISAELNMSLSTVKYHNQSIFEYLGVSNRVDAVIKGIITNELSPYDIYDYNK